MGTYLYHGKKEKKRNFSRRFYAWPSASYLQAYVVYQSYMYHNTHSMSKATVRNSNREAVLKKIDSTTVY